jgi:hypothetical protein
VRCWRSGLSPSNFRLFDAGGYRKAAGPAIGPR